MLLGMVIIFCVKFHIMDTEVISILRLWKVTCYSLVVVCHQPVCVLEAWFSMWQYLREKMEPPGDEAGNQMIFGCCPQKELMRVLLSELVPMRVDYFKTA